MPAPHHPGFSSQRLRRLKPVLITLLLILTAGLFTLLFLVRALPWREDFYNTDLLYLPALFRDFASATNLLYWRPPPAPYFFPDALLYFFARTVSGSDHLAMALNGALQALVFTLGMALLYRAQPGRALRWVEALALAVTACALYLTALPWAAPGMPYLFLTTTHTGVAITLPYLLALCLALLQPGRPRRQTALLGGLMVAMAGLLLVSDSLALVHFLLPAGAALLALALLRGAPWRRAALVAGLLAAAWAAARLIYQPPPWFPEVGAYLGISRSGVETGVQGLKDWLRYSLKQQPLVPLAWAIFGLACLVAVVAGVRRRFVFKEQAHGQGFFPLYYLFLNAGTLAALLLSGTFSDRFGERYLTPLLLPALFFGWPLVYAALRPPVGRHSMPRLSLPRRTHAAKDAGQRELASNPALHELRASVGRHFMPRLSLPADVDATAGVEDQQALGQLPLASSPATPRQQSLSLPGRIQAAKDAAWNAALLLVLLLLNLPAIMRLGELRAYRNYNPPLVECLDETLSARGLRQGLASYWDAKYIQFLSKTGLRVVQVDPLLVPYPWINNPAWYEGLRPQFIVIDPAADARGLRLDSDEVTGRFGPPAETLSCGSREILVYDRPEDRAFQSLVTGNPGLVPLAPGERAVFEAAALPGEVGRIVELKRAAENEPAGPLTTGPYAYLLPGRYRFAIHYTASAESGWEVAVDEGGKARLLQSGSLPADLTQQTSEFAIARDGTVEIRTVYAGQGRLAVERIELERLE